MLHVGRALLTGIALLACQWTAKADVFDFTFFDNSNNVVGTGTFSYTGDVGDGTFYVDTLPNYQFNFTVGLATWTNADLTTTISGVQAVFYDNDSQMYFSNDGTYGGDQGGSADFDSGATVLTFEPPFFGAPPLDLYQAYDGSSSFGPSMFTATMPEPSTGALILAGIGIVALRFRRSYTESKCGSTRSL